MNRQPQSGSVLLLATISIGTASANETQPSASTPVLPSIAYEEVVVEASSAVPAAFGRLTAEDIATYRPYSLHDALRFIPGVRTIDDDALGRRAGISVRGAPGRRSRKTLLLEDGTPLNASTYLDPSAHYTPPMERLERVDVLKGNGMILNGPLNNHGIVSFVNKRATLEPETTVELAYGELDSFKRHLMHTRTAGPVGLVFAYTGMDADGTFDVEEHTFDDMYASADWRIDERNRLDASFTYFRERSNYDESNLTPLEFALDPRRKRGRFGQEFNTIAVDYFKGDVAHDLQLSDRVKVTTRFFATNLDRPRFTVEPEEILVDALPDFVYDDPDTRFIRGVQGEMVSRDRHYRTYGIESRMEVARLQGFGALHTLQAGARYEDHELSDQRFGGGPGEVLDAGNRGDRTRTDMFEAHAYSVFFQDAIEAGNWVVTPGARVEYYYQSLQRTFGNPGALQSDNHALLLPGISLLYKGFGATQVYASSQRGYAPGNARTAGGFPLEPEVGINSQIGIRSTALRGVSVDVAGFYNDLTDTLVNTPVTIDGQDLVINAGNSEAYGIDLGLRVDSAAYTNDVLNWFGEVAYNYTEARFTEGPIDGNDVPEVPNHVAAFTFGVEQDRHWHLSMTVSHFGSFFTDNANTRAVTLADEDLQPIAIGQGDTLEIREPAVIGLVPSYTLLSARASYTPPRWQHVTLWIQGRNLTDNLYVSDHENGMRPGPERTVIGGVRIRF